MTSLKKKIKTIKWRLKVNLLALEYDMIRSKKRIDFVKQETVNEKEQRMFKFISKHASKRLKERMLYWGYSMDDIHQDILNSKERYKRKEATKIIGKLGTYIISQAGNLITVI